MLARLQQFIVAGLLALAALWLALTRHESPALVVSGLLVLGLAHALFLGLEFALMHHVNRRDPAPRASGSQLVRAWLAESLQAPRVFAWRQPFRSRALADRLQGARAGQAGVVFVHGFVCNRGFWNPWMQRLRRTGHPHVAVDLEPVFGSIDDYVPRVDAAVRRLYAASGRPVLLVCHSMGGLAARAWLASRDDAPALVSQVVTLGTPHQGTWLGRWGTSPNGRQMQLDSPWLRSLAGRETAALRARLVCYYSNCDNIVFPAGTAALPGADNRFVAGLAHVAMAFDEALISQVLGRLDADARVAPGGADPGV